jgi:hypothetical protein
MKGDSMVRKLVGLGVGVGVFYLLLSDFSPMLDVHTWEMLLLSCIFGLSLIGNRGE